MNYYNEFDANAAEFVRAFMAARRAETAPLLLGTGA